MNPRSRAGTARPYVGVVGPGDASEELCRVAADVGALLAASGAVVVTGGLGGVMAAAAMGAREAGGRTIGVLPGRDRTSANEWVEVAVATGLGEGRNAVLVSTVDAVLAVGSSWGTLSEVALAMRASIPVVAIDGWEVRDHEGRPVEPGPRRAATAAAAVAMIRAALGDGDHT